MKRIASALEGERGMAEVTRLGANTCNTPVKAGGFPDRPKAGVFRARRPLFSRRLPALFLTVPVHLACQ